MANLADEDGEVDALVDIIEHAVWERHAGRVFRLADFTPEEWQLFVLWCGLEKEFITANQIKLTAIMEAVFLKKS